MKDKNFPKKRKFISINTANKKRKNDLYKVPTIEELIELKEAETTFHSSLFKMEFDELMNEMNKKFENKEALLSWIKKLEEFLYCIPASDVFSLRDLSWLNETVKIPILQKPSSNKGNFKFVPPTKITVIGSFMLETMCTDELTIDIALEIPKSSWNKMDFLNHRYHRKRAMYLAYIAQALLETDFISSMKFSYQNDCYLKPILLIIPKEIQNFTIALFPYPENGSFKLSRFIPIRNNVRSSWFFGTQQNDLDKSTPYYNSTILSDVLLPELNKFLKEILVPNVKNGIILLKIWCIQRDFFKGYGRLNGFLVTMFVAYLLKKKRINSLMNAYQVFRCTLLALQNEKILEDGLTLFEETNSNNKPSLKDFHQVYDVVFIDSSGFLNLYYEITKETILNLKHEAKLGLKILDEGNVDSFYHLFVNKINFCKKFEYLLHLKGPKKFKKYCKILNMEDKRLDYGISSLHCILPKICDILSFGLKNRINLMDVIKIANNPWPITELPPSPNVAHVIIGFLLNPDIPITNLEKGPSADDPMVKQFREFWGDRSEMRRFQDGSICEAVLWPASTEADRRNVFSLIIKDILKKHIGANPKHITITGTEIDALLQISQEFLPIKSPQYGTGEEIYIQLMQSFNLLSKQLRNLEGLPLLIASLQGISPAFRFTDVFPPISAILPDKKMYLITNRIAKINSGCEKAPPYIPALHVILFLEGSGKWPDDKDALERVKAAFHIKIAELVKSQLSLIAVPFIKYTDILKDGFIFRIEVSCFKELSLLKQICMPNGMIKIKETKESQDLKVITQTLPKLTSMLHGLHQQHNSYGIASRLAKRWISAHMFHQYINDIVIELITAYIYVQSESFTCPSIPQVAFIRFLNLLSSHEWNIHPLIVNLNNEIKKNEIEEIYSSFRSQRSILPAMVIITPFDKIGDMWTRENPTGLILEEITLLARKCLTYLENMLCQREIWDIKKIFRPNMDLYDVVIYIKETQITRIYSAIDIPKNLNELFLKSEIKETCNEIYPVVEYDPIQKFLHVLRENFDEFANFFCDVYGGNCIGIKWKTSSFIPKDFKTSKVNGRFVNFSDNIYIAPQVEAILEDIQILGSKLVKHIEKKS